MIMIGWEPVSTSARTMTTRSGRKRTDTVGARFLVSAVAMVAMMLIWLVLAQRAPAETPISGPSAASTDSVDVVDLPVDVTTSASRRR